jgi:2,5-diketo-D-gluconate reductase A
MAMVTLNDGCSIPQLGFGVWQVPAGDTEGVVAHALKVGYRHIDTAAAYGNEEGVGAAIRDSGLAREDLFVTTKLWNGDHGRDAALRAFDASLARLGLEQVDLYLIHWPVPSAGRYVETWQALVELRESGRARSIGVSNFMEEHLEGVIDATGVVPAVNQTELHPGFAQAALRDFHDRLGIVTEAWSPLGQGASLRDPIVVRLAREQGRTPAQIVIRWHLQLGNVVIPKSVTPERIRANLDLFDFELSEDDLAAIARLEAGHRTGPDPETFGAA